MAAQIVIDHTVSTTAPAETVFALLADGSTWPSWSPIGKFDLLEPGEGTPEGLGALRRFTTMGIKSCERVVVLDAPTTFSYVLERGIPLRDYRATATLTPAERGGTTINYRSTFFVKYPGTGWFYRYFLGRVIGQVAHGLADEASKRFQSVA
jgi:polyketide cyclase/dehydrase/lipid transport protein